MARENQCLMYYQPMDFSHGRSKFSTIGWQSDCNFNPPAISRWTRKCPGNVADSSCELLDFSRKKHSNTRWYPRNDNRYPLGHEHGYLSACMCWGMQVKAFKMNGNLLFGGASVLRCSAECSAQCALSLHLRPPQFAQCSTPPSFAIVLQLLPDFWPSHFARHV